MVDKALFSSDSTTWETPQNLFDELNKEFWFELDVCASMENAKCNNYFDELADGLKQPWSLMNWRNLVLNQKNILLMLVGWFRKKVYTF